MSTTFRTHPDHAVVLFDDELTWPAATDLVDIVDLMTDGYFYRRIEIVIASPGGLTAVLDHYLTALQRWRAAGVWITTRVVSRAQSAAALVLSISDERIRPLSTLAPGECYAALADGRFERRQLEPVLPRAVERAPALRLVHPSPDLQP